MAFTTIRPPYPSFFEANGTALEDGYIWIGEVNKDPQNFPYTVYWDAALTLPAAQPIRTINGYASYNGSPGTLYAANVYSIRVQNKKGTTVYTDFNVTPDDATFFNYAVNQEIQTATAGQTVFTLTTMSYQPATNNLNVFVDGVNQISGGSYAFTETNSTTVTFASGLHEGAVVKFTTATSLSAGVTDAASVMYTPAGTGAVATTVQAKLRESVSVFDFMSAAQIADVQAGTALVDVTAAIQAAIDAAENVYIPAGTYIVDQINISTSTQVTTAGMTVIFQQKNTASRNDEPIINITVSNVSVGDMTFIGNIATDAGEWNHCINILGTGSEIRNITLGRYYATNIRGDVLYVGGVSTTPVYDVNVVSLDGDNIYRSICSVTGGQGVRIQQILGNRVGYRNIDFETNVGSQKIDDCWVGFVRGGCVQLASDSAALRIGSIQIDQLDLDNAYMPAPTPYAVYTNPAGPDIGILCSRFDYFKIGSLKLNSYGTIGVNLSDVPGEDKGRVIIDYIEATNIAPSGAYLTVIESSGATLVEVNSGKVTLAAGTNFLKGADSDYVIRNIEFVGSPNSSVASYCTDLYCENISGNFGNRDLFGNVTNGQVINSRLTTTAYAMNQCADMSWYNCTLDCGDFDFSPAAGSNKAAFDRGTLNGTWYDNYSITFGGTTWASKMNVIQGTGTPEGVVTAAIGALFVRTDGGAGTTLYVKESGTGNTGWVGK